MTILHHLDDAWLLELALEALVAGLELELELENVAAVAGLFFSADLKICSSAVIVVFLVLLHRPSTCGLLQTILQDWETESPLKKEGNWSNFEQASLAQTTFAHAVALTIFLGTSALQKGCFLKHQKTFGSKP